MMTPHPGNLQRSDSDPKPGFNYANVYEGFDPGGVVYLCYDRKGDLLYVGKTANWLQRRDLHMYSFWWDRVTRVEFISVPSPAERFHRELSMIDDLKPKCNEQQGSAVWHKSAVAPYVRELRKALARRNRQAMRAGLGPVENFPDGAWVGRVGTPAYEMKRPSR